MTPAWCPKSGTDLNVSEVDGEGVGICPGCARTVVVKRGRIVKHRLPATTSAPR